MTEDELKAIEARANAATPNLTVNGRSDGIFIRGADRLEHVALFSGTNLVNDSNFYERARTDIPALIHALREERQALREAREALRKASKTLDALGFATMDGDKTIVSREAWSEAMAMRDEIDMEFFNARKALGEE